MKHISFVSIFKFSLLWLAAKVTAKCRTRVEIRDLTPPQILEYIQALHALQKTKDSRGYSLLDTVASFHDANFNEIHSAQYFFPWHRKLLYYIEDALREFNPNIVIPYWDWTYDASQPAASIVLSNTWFGPAEKTGQCFPAGQFKNWRVEYPNNHCLARTFGSGTFFSQSEVESLVKKAVTHNELFANVNAGPHGIPHTTIGGDMTKGYSPNDPLFFFHHSYIDKLWYDWQMSGGGNQYEWPLEQEMPMFGDRVINWLDPRAPSYCIEYAPARAIRGLPPLKNTQPQQQQPAQQPHIQQQVQQVQQQQQKSEFHFQLQLPPQQQIRSQITFQPKVNQGNIQITPLKKRGVAKDESLLQLPVPFTYTPEEVPTVPLQDVPDHFLKMHNITREEFMKVKNFVDERRRKLSDH